MERKVIFPEQETLGELALKAAEKYKTKTCFQIYRGPPAGAGEGEAGGIYDKLSYAEFGRRVEQFALLLRELGLKKNDRVMILAENRPEWPVAYFGAALAGAVSVPVLVDFAAEQLRSIAEHAGISALCFTERTAPKAAALITGDSRLPGIRLDSLEGDGILIAGNGEERRFSLPALPGGNKAAFPHVSKTDPASIIYTSGTTGQSKGVALSHRNLVFTALASRTLMKTYSRDRLLSVIPLAHTYECTLGLISPLLSGASITYLDRPPSPVILLQAMQTLRPTAMISVPLFIEKICRNRIFPALEANPLYKCPLTRPIAVTAAGGRLLAALGSSLRFFGIGGAPLAEDVERFLRKAGFPYSPGYGLTETSPLVAGTAPYKFPFRSAGSVVKGVEARIGEGGEIQIRGPNVMIGYYRDEERTRAAFTEDGWFKSGDLGSLDKKGRLFIRGRLKTLILGPSGENIYPEEIEELIHTSGLVEDVLVVPGDRGELVALVVLSEKAKTALAALGESLEALKNQVNKRLAAFSRLNRIEIREEPFEKTPTQKIKRFLYSSQDKRMEQKI
jgi:long-chain acyl-CoA synthetase